MAATHPPRQRGAAPTKSRGKPETQRHSMERTIRVVFKGSKVRLPGGNCAVLPDPSTIQLSEAAMICPVDGSRVDLAFRCGCIEVLTPGAKVVLVGQATVYAPRNQPIDFCGAKTSELQLPSGTLLEFAIPNSQYALVPLGGGLLKTSCSLRDVVVLPADSAVTLDQSITLGPDGLDLKDDTLLPKPVFLAGPMTVRGSVLLPGALLYDEPPMVNTLTTITTQKTYGPGALLDDGTLLCFATLLPLGIILNAETVIPGGTTLPAGTVLSPGTSLCPRTSLPAGLRLPAGTSVPHSVYRRLEMLDPAKEI